MRIVQLNFHFQFYLFKDVSNALNKNDLMEVTDPEISKTTAVTDPEISNVSILLIVPCIIDVTN